MITAMQPKITEWTEQSKYNSFNSMKGLTYYEHYKKIVGWLDGKNELPPPIEVNLDPFAACNISCYFCIGQRYLRDHPEECSSMRILPMDYITRLIKFLAEWGVRGLCISGGGDPSLHHDTPAMIQLATDKGMKVTMFTNTTNITQELAAAIMKCQWITMSVNCGDRETYFKIAGKDYFDRVILNIKKLVELKRETGSCVGLAYRMLVLPETQNRIYEACLLAKTLGCTYFNVRPVDFEREDIKNHQALDIDVERVRQQFDRCHELEDENFRVFTTVHKFDAQFHNKRNFTHCLASPILLPILSDGNAYLCVDQKMKPRFKTGNCFPNPEKIKEWWGGEAHRQMIKDIDPGKDCADCRCTFQVYHEQIEKVVLNDAMSVCFP